MFNFLIPEYINIKFNVDKDINDIARKRLLFLNAKFKENNDLYIQLINFHKRHISIKPRKIKVSKEFKIKDKYIKAYEKFIDKVERGDNLNEYLSTTIEQSHFNDNLFNIYSLVHFHLGDKLAPKKNKFNNRYYEKQTDILIAKVTDDTIYILSLEPHESNEWNEEDYKEYNRKKEKDNKEKNNNPKKGQIKATDVTFLNDKYLKIIIEEFPELIEKYKVKNMTVKEVEFNKKIILKKDNVTIPTVVNDNSYLSENLGVSCNGHTVMDIMEFDSIRRALEHDVIYGIKKYLYEINQKLERGKDYEISVVNFITGKKALYEIKRENKCIAHAVRIYSELLFNYKPKKEKRFKENKIQECIKKAVI